MEQTRPVKDWKHFYERGEQAEIEACRLIGGCLDPFGAIWNPARDSLKALTGDLDDLGGPARDVLRIFQVYGAKAGTVADVLAIARRRGLVVAQVEPFLAQCLTNPTMDADRAVAVVNDFLRYAARLRQVERLETYLWSGGGEDLLLPDAGDSDSELCGASPGGPCGCARGMSKA